MRLVFLGPPGAGKGTQADLLEERMKVVHFSSGDMLRAAARGKDEVGLQITQIMKSGGLVPDNLVLDLIFRQIDKLHSGAPFTLDGFPRTVEQAKALNERLETDQHAVIDLAVDFEISSNDVVKRLAGRRTCTQCGAIYHVERLKPRKEGVCDRCGAGLAVRPDDQPETILKRLEVYRSEAQPLLDFYGDRDQLRSVSGGLEVEAQYEALIDLLKKEALVGT